MENIYNFIGSDHNINKIRKEIENKYKDLIFKSIEIDVKNIDNTLDILLSYTDKELEEFCRMYNIAVDKLMPNYLKLILSNFDILELVDKLALYESKKFMENKNKYISTSDNKPIVGEVKWDQKRECFVNLWSKTTAELSFKDDIAGGCKVGDILIWDKDCTKYKVNYDDWIKFPRLVILQYCNEIKNSNNETILLKSRVYTMNFLTRTPYIFDMHPFSNPEHKNWHFIKDTHIESFNDGVVRNFLSSLEDSVVRDMT